MKRRTTVRTPVLGVEQLENRSLLSAAAFEAAMLFGRPAVPMQLAHVGLQSVSRVASTPSASFVSATAVSASQLSQILMRGTYPITNSYRPWGGPTGHAGIDFGSTGDGVTSVYAPVSGTITANTSACGKVAIFDGQNTIILAHLTARNTTLAVGSTITAGIYVGKASQVVGGGCTVTGPHLHIEIRTGNNTFMADPTRDNRATTLDPLAYPWDTTAPSITITSPLRNATLTRGFSYRLSWSASDPSGLGDVAVDLVSGAATTCQGATSLASIRAGGLGYVSVVTWTVPAGLRTGSYNLKVAVRDGLITWGCTMIPVTIR